ncbi:MAG TPA: C1 family peptidase [Jatrophihabitans sp.]|jgi:C1A family cysteine protease|uniref:C1 family peptidase n=1 Tax=Jatrophihabitans sp. TaxID=1932789 RepID=UPI002DFE8A42|nr:C1 family peptidase [Jatrophihabitans sp.]
MTSTPRRLARYGWVPDLPDTRDHIFAAAAPTLAALPSSVDLTAQCPPVYDQGRIGSCTANAIGAAVEFDLHKQGLTDFMPSRLFIYYNERAMEGHVGNDSGAAIRDGVKSVHQLGVCPESEWPYDDTPATSDGGRFPPGARDGEQPSAQCYTDALNNRAAAYTRVTRDLNHMRACLATGYPFVFGFTVYESFESAAVAASGVVPMPASTEHVLGGHAVLAVGYDDGQQRFVVRNSWGTGWGQHGYFTMPYDYLTNRGLASDFWTITMIS